MGELIRLDHTVILDELRALGLVEAPEVPDDYRLYRHLPGPEGGRELTITYSTELHEITQAAFYHFGIRRWRHVGVGVKGQLQHRLADQKAIGRQRGPGERSPAPLPDWYELNHMAYGHWEDFGFDPSAPVWQILPPPDAPYLNVAEVLHLRQPA